MKTTLNFRVVLRVGIKFYLQFLFSFIYNRVEIKTPLVGKANGVDANAWQLHLQMVRQKLIAHSVLSIFIITYI